MEMPLEVAACWNGVVAFPAKPYIRNKSEEAHSNDRSEVRARGWHMMDSGTLEGDLLDVVSHDLLLFKTATYAGSLHSPPVPTPVRFRGPLNSDPCDHSEAFFWSYDIHRRLRGQRRPRIYMNPTVKVAYELRWYRWNTIILQMPLVRLWQSESCRIPRLVRHVLHSDSWASDTLASHRNLEPWASPSPLRLGTGVDGEIPGILHLGGPAIA